VVERARTQSRRVVAPDKSIAVVEGLDENASGGLAVDAELDGLASAIDDHELRVVRDDTDPLSNGADPSTIQVPRESPYSSTAAAAVERIGTQSRRTDSGVPSPLLVDAVASARSLESNITICTLIAAYNTSLPEGAICNLIEILNSTLVDGEADVSATEVTLLKPTPKKPALPPRRRLVSSPRFSYAKSPTPGASVPSDSRRFLESTATPTLALMRPPGYIVFEANALELNCTQIAANLSIIPGVYNVSVDVEGTIGNVSDNATLFYC
jgi:hypothetical protein